MGMREKVKIYKGFAVGAENIPREGTWQYDRWKQGYQSFEAYTGTDKDEGFVYQNATPALAATAVEHTAEITPIDTREPITEPGVDERRVA
jgi:hypothetical protein